MATSPGASPAFPTRRTFPRPGRCRPTPRPASWSPTAARWLVDHRRIRAIGIDTASIDHGPSTHFESHRVFCAANVPVFENVASLDGVPATGAFVVALPMKIAGGSGGPLRIVARLPE